jgi:antitoxin PrlF
MQTSTLTAKGQVTIPAEVRRFLNLKPGDQVAFVVEDGRVTLVRSEDRIEAAFGLITADLSVSHDDMDRAIRERAGR